MSEDQDLWEEIYKTILTIPTKAKIPLHIARERDIPTPPVGIGKALFGLPVIVFEPQGAVFRGQYVSHSQFTSEDGEEVWVIRLGLFSIMAVFVDEYTDTRVYYPFAENGVLTAVSPQIIEWMQRGRDNYGRRFAGYFECVGNFRVGFVECLKSDILYLDMVSQGKLPLILIDKYRILRTLPPSQLIEEFASLHYALREMIRLKARYEREIRRLKMQAMIRESEYVTLKKDVDELWSIIRTLLTENRRLREELERRDIRERFREVGIETYRSLTDSLERTIRELQDLFDRVTSVRERLEEIVRPVMAPTAPAPMPSPKEEEKEEEKEERAGGGKERGRFLRLRGGGGG